MFRIVRQHAVVLVLGILIGMSKVPDVNAFVTGLGLSWVGSFILAFISGVNVQRVNDFNRHINCFFALSVILFILAVAFTMWGVK